MKHELEKKLFEAFPKVLPRCSDPSKSCMAWGMECGDGWYDLIYELCEKLTAEIEKLPEEEQELCQASQIKEKYGTLRFYMTSATEEMWNIINEYEDKSESVCEVCGKPGERRNGGWITTLCDLCNKARVRIK